MTTLITADLDAITTLENKVTDLSDAIAAARHLLNTNPAAAVTMMTMIEHVADSIGAELYAMRMANTDGSDHGHQAS